MIQWLLSGKLISAGSGFPALHAGHQFLLDIVSFVGHRESILPTLYTERAAATRNSLERAVLEPKGSYSPGLSLPSIPTSPLEGPHEVSGHWAQWPPHSPPPGDQQQQLGRVYRGGHGKPPALSAPSPKHLAPVAGSSSLSLH